MSNSKYKIIQQYNAELKVNGKDFNIPIFKFEGKGITNYNFDYALEWTEEKPKTLFQVYLEDFIFYIDKFRPEVWRLDKEYLLTIYKITQFIYINAFKRGFNDAVNTEKTVQLTQEILSKIKSENLTNNNS